MLNSVKVDFSVLPQPFAAIACSEGNQVAIRIESLGYNVTGIVFTHKAIEERKETIKAFYRAYNRAIDYLNDKPIDDFVKILIGEVGFTEKSLSYLHLPVQQGTVSQDHRFGGSSQMVEKKELTACRL